MHLVLVIATYNSAATLGECLDSVLAQRWSDYSVIVKDGGSSDGTLALLQEYCRRSDRIRLLTGRDAGVYDAWNQALREARGDWVTFLGSDDYLTDPEALGRVAVELQQAAACGLGLAYGRNRVIDTRGAFVAELGEDWNTARQGIRQRMTIRHPGCFCSLELLRRIGGFDASFGIIGDYDFVLSALRHSEVHFYAFPVVCHRLGGLSTNPARLWQVLCETYRLRRKHGLRPYLYPNSEFRKRLLLYLLSRCLPQGLLQALLRRRRGGA